ncbi:thioredoxin reductase [Bacillus mesophilus]|uniref:NAD(P)-binding domain-containing protein n=1 Tax=Bacillus mesophilus TaxID=1808955 RepID=A0A6M0Q4H8_9BACI|nr:NAD(P)-binding domain-containing protein [Bacillus mesophilus]MBM7661329.1 thioredoxin reductase [Bacillus mesophilus]NEY71152.1 NAD(P)-binding domain-containing protein [Bacillus mesophilus]
MKTRDLDNLPIAIIGGGAIGLAAAAQLLTKGERFTLFESGETVGASILEWGHVKMFSPWQYNIDQAANTLLKQTGWTSPNLDDIPTGRQLVEEYLLPLSNIPEISKNIVTNAKVVGVVRKGMDKLKTLKREEAPFQLYVEIKEETKVYEVKAVIDASGTWKNPNPVLSNGLWTNSEKKLSNRIYYGIPNVLEDLKNRYKNKKVMVVGSGHSAINAILDLAQLKEMYNQTTVYWVLRKANISQVYGGQDQDGLPARGQLGIRIRKLVESGQINIITPFHISKLTENDELISVGGDLNGEETTIHGIEEIIVSTGFRPDTSFLNEIRINLDSAVESVDSLAPLIDPNIHSCGTVRPHGEAELRQIEKDFYIVGMKSYGRAPTFLLATGYEQVRSVVAYLTGDYKGAKEVHLVLPETGVCSVNRVAERNTCNSDSLNEESGSCCGEIKVTINKTSCC